jgi:hypothetical protein
MPRPDYFLGTGQGDCSGRQLMVPCHETVIGWGEPDVKTLASLVSA